VLRRELRSAERFRDAAIFFGSVSLKTPCFRSSASLSLVTRSDHRPVMPVWAMPFLVSRLSSASPAFAYSQPGF
jgi:hypothetical protein